MKTDPFSHCPRCGEEWKPGFLRTGQRGILWTPSNKHRFTMLPETGEEFELPGSRSLQGTCCPARYCENCGLILIETKEEFR